MQRKIRQPSTPQPSEARMMRLKHRPGGTPPRVRRRLSSQQTVWAGLVVACTLLLVVLLAASATGGQSVSALAAHDADISTDSLQSLSDDGVPGTSTYMVDISDDEDGEIVFDLVGGPARDGAAFVTQSPYLTVAPRQSFQIYFDVRNTGSTTWRRRDNYYLGNINSIALGALARQELSRDVAPGASYRFTMNMTAPRAEGVYATQWMVRHGSSNFGPNMFIIVTVRDPQRPARDDAAFVGKSPNLTVQAGQRFSIYFDLRNSGNTTWRRGDNYYLAAQGNTLGANNRQELAGDVAPGGTTRFSLSLTAPNAAGTYRTPWMIRHGSSNFGPYMYVEVRVPATPVGDACQQRLGSFVPAAQSGRKDFKVPASVTLAQLILEATCGRDHIGDANNYFGIKAQTRPDGSVYVGTIATGWVSVPTQECDRYGKCSPTQARFRKYKSMADSFRDHANFFIENSRYAEALKHTNDPDEFARQIAKAGYATDPNYASKLINIMKQYNLYQYDTR